jgi:hypothetical protein
MPVEIRQLVINSRVVADDTSEPPVTMNGSSGKAEEQLEIIERCVAEVMRILEDRQER